MFHFRPLIRALCALVALIAFAHQSTAATRQVLVFAAASLKESLEEAGQAFTATNGVEVIYSFASSGVLAKQIAAGAPADLFISADLAWMDDVDQKSLIRHDTRVTLLSNTLVVIAPASTTLSHFDFSRESFAAALGTSRLATGEVNSVPAGLYAKAAFQNLGLWDFIEPKLAQADNVRSALAFVARGEAALGVVYATDAKIEPKVQVVQRFPEGSHAPIIYPAALTANSQNPDAEKFLTFLASPQAQAIFERAGFVIPPR